MKKDSFTMSVLDLFKALSSVESLEKKKQCYIQVFFCDLGSSTEELEGYGSLV